MSAAQLSALMREHGDASITLHPSRAANCRCHALRIPWCNRHLEWKLVLDQAAPGSPPDILFDDPTFSPLWGAAGDGGGAAGERLRALLTSWDASSPGALAALVAALLTAFLEHQRERMQRLGDERLLFELSMLEELGCRELLLTDARSPGGARACFGVPLREGLDASCADKALSYLAPTPAPTPPPPREGAGQAAATAAGEVATPPLAQPLPGVDALSLGSPGQAPRSGAPAAGPATGGDGGGGGDAAAAAAGPPPRAPPGREDAFKLVVAFKVGPGTAHSAPELHLQAPLMEYVPLVGERLQAHLQAQCGALVARFELVEHLATMLGPPLEANMAAGAVPPSTGAPAAGAVAASAAPGVAAWHVIVADQPFLVLLELGRGFPEEMPALTLQSVKRPGPEGASVYTRYPWSPRWGPDEMAARIFNFLRDEAAAVATKLGSAW